MIEVFVTNVATTDQAGQLSTMLARQFPMSGISFDLDDCDRVLRIEGPALVPDHITSLLSDCGFECRVME